MRKNSHTGMMCLHVCTIVSVSQFEPPYHTLTSSCMYNSNVFLHDLSCIAQSGIGDFWLYVDKSHTTSVSINLSLMFQNCWEGCGGTGTTSCQIKRLFTHPLMTPGLGQHHRESRGKRIILHPLSV